MKKFLMAALLAGSVFSFISCNNGDYDAQPKVNNNEKNPLDPNSGVTVFLGTLRMDINGTEWLFTKADYKFLDNVYMIEAELPNDSIFQRKVKMSITGGGAEYKSALQYSFLDTLTLDTTIIYANTDNSLFLKFNGNESNNIRGTFHGTIYRTSPNPDGGDYLSITRGEFYVPKEK